MVILRKLVRKLLTTGFMFLLDLFLGMKGGWGLLNCMCLFLGGRGGLLGDLNAEKWSDHQKKKVFINKSVEALIPLKEGY